MIFNFFFIYFFQINIFKVLDFDRKFEQKYFLSLSDFSVYSQSKIKSKFVVVVQQIEGFQTLQKEFEFLHL